MFTCVILEKAYYFIFIFMCMDVLPSCVSLCTQRPQRSKEGVRSSGTGITTVSHHMGARNQTQILWKSISAAPTEEQKRVSLSPGGCSLLCPTVP